MMWQWITKYINLYRKNNPDPTSAVSWAITETKSSYLYCASDLPRIKTSCLHSQKLLVVWISLCASRTNIIQIYLATSWSSNINITTGDEDGDKEQVPTVGLKPMTCWLEVTHSTDWAPVLPPRSIRITDKCSENKRGIMQNLIPLHHFFFHFTGMKARWVQSLRLWLHWIWSVMVKPNLTWKPDHREKCLYDKHLNDHLWNAFFKFCSYLYFSGMLLCCKFIYMYDRCDHRWTLSLCPSLLLLYTCRWCLLMAILSGSKKTKKTSEQFGDCT